MLEHVGYKNYSRYMQIVADCLADDGLFLLHTIGRKTSAMSGNRWIRKYIFPNSMLPSAKQLAQAYEGLLVMEDWHNFGADYDRTLIAWHNNFNQYWFKLKTVYDQRFFRMWNFYLLISAGAFRARDIQLWQVVFSKCGVLEGYQRPLY